MSTTFTVPALRTELQTDPAALGYAALMTAGNDQGIADVLNLVRAGAGFVVFRNDVPVADVVGAIAAADFTALTALLVAKLQLLFAGGKIDATSANVRQNFAGIFGSATQATKDAIAAAAQRQGSRAEVLWGTGFAVTPAQVAQAR